MRLSEVIEARMSACQYCWGKKKKEEEGRHTRKDCYGANERINVAIGEGTFCPSSSQSQPHAGSPAVAQPCGTSPTSVVQLGACVGVDDDVIEQEVEQRFYVRKFYKGGQFIPGGARAPKGGGWYWVSRA